jgi:hypothetical protein
MEYLKSYKYEDKEEQMEYSEKIVLSLSEKEKESKNELKLSK